MNKAERMGGAYHPYSPDTIADYEMMLSPSCSSAVARAQEALGRLDAGGALVDTEPLARLLLRAEAGILRQNSKNRKSGIYVADEVVAAFNAYERSLCQPST